MLQPVFLICDSVVVFIYAVWCVIALRRRSVYLRSRSRWFYLLEVCSTAFIAVKLDVR